MVNMEPAFYEGVGRVVVAAAQLELSLACMVFATTPSPDDLWKIASVPGRALRDLRRLGSQMPTVDTYDEVRTIAADAEGVLRERHRISHSLYLAGQPSEGSLQGYGVHPRQRTGGEDQPPDPLPTPDELHGLTQQLVAVAARAYEWLIRNAGFPDPRRAGAAEPS